MELGNLLFGNSRGTYPIERGEGWEKAFDKLCRAIDPKTGGYGENYENDTFSMMTYYWGGDCTCGFDYHDDGHKKLRNLKHTKECYQSKYKDLKEKICKKYKVENAYQLRDKEAKAYDLEVAKLCTSMGLTYPNGYGVHCTCDFDVRAEKILDQYEKDFGARECLPTCMLVKPNFLYKPTGFGISWYKYYMRDAYSNQKISLKEFQSIIKACIKSL